jgi:hypothetical protein
MKRVVVISDLHCGHAVGLTHPDFEVRHEDENEKIIDSARRRYWKFYADTITALQPVDVLIVNGDAIEGKGVKSGGTELIAPDRTEQVAMAVAAIQYVKAGKVFMSFGTGYHTGNMDDWEREVASDVDAEKIGSHDWLDVNGLLFDYKHHIGGSSTPYGRHTALSKEHVWNVMWAEHDEYPKSNVLIRSHVHYYGFAGGFGWVGFTTPALQGYGSKYGARRMSGTVDFGFLSFDVEGKEDWAWKAHIQKQRKLRTILKA